MEAIPLMVFWLLVVFARSELGWRGAGIAVAVWAGLLAGFLFGGDYAYVFVAAGCLQDVVLIMIVFKGDVR